MTDLLLCDARIWTGIDGAPWAEAALVRHGRFVFVGRGHEIEAPREVQTLDAGGRLVLPGLVDGHAHLLSTGMAMRAVDLKGVTTVGEAVQRVAERVAAMPADAWVQGAGWDQNLWPGARFPNRRDLDAVAPSHPVVLAHTSGHCIWVNSVALRAAGVTSSTEAPVGGKIDADRNGEPTGILLDTAARLVYDVAPRPSEAERVTALGTAIAHAHSLGVTCVHAMDVGRSELDSMQALRRDGALRLRTRVFLAARRLQEWCDAGVHTGDGDDLLNIGGVKFFADGALGSLTAWMVAPYEGTQDRGLALQPPSELALQVNACLEHGLAPAIHAIGDKANHEVLSILERTRSVAPELPRRIEHAQLLAIDDIARFGPLGMTASVQPIHATQDFSKADRAWGARGRNAYAFASLLAAGVNLAFGSDSPVETMNPLAGIHAAVTRRTAQGVPAGGWYPEERISLTAALTAYTAGCARAMREEGQLGKIAPGYFGDFVVLSNDLFELDDPMRIAEVRADVTVVGGDVVYERDQATAG